ncbi:uncharacterized protein [Aegilops tauschii subsp. strangulata]|uniref:uncharacterized protein n=1 Tax=Aegilops tauschii subsp. strangulata TaxID=200361 RepID=UPI001E1CA16A|nr:uncharacterized protein LOC109747000 [Aegilops tauschii subsp. strangulata]
MPAAALPDPPIEILQTASSTSTLPATTGIVPVDAASSVTTGGSAPAVNWSLPPNKPGGATPAREIAPPSATPGVNWSLPPLPLPVNNFHHEAVLAQETAASSGGAAGSVAASANGLPTPAQESKLAASSSSSIAPADAKATVNWSLVVTPPTNAGTASVAGQAAGSKWATLLSKIVNDTALPDPEKVDGCIWRVDVASLPPGACTPVVVALGPLFPVDQAHQGMEETKWKYVQNLIRRGHRKEDAKNKLTEYLTHINSMEVRIRQRYDPSELHIPKEKLVEKMVVDGLFVIEVLMNHWVGKIDKGSASPEATASTAAESRKADFTAPLASTLVPQDRREEFTPLNVRWEPYALRFDLVAVPNQIPFFVLEELFKMTDIPELGELEKKPVKLKQIILDYLVGDAGDDMLAVYEGRPVFHILHLVYLYLTFSKEEPKVSALQPKRPVTVTRSSSLDTALGKLKQKGMDLRALYRRTVTRSSSLPVGWRQWKVIPPLRELVRVGVKVKRAETPRFAEVRFRNGVLEIPAFAWRRYHIRLLTNLVVLEMSGWWPPEKRVFCSYVRFMAELMMKKEDVAILFKKGVVLENNIDDVEKSLICPFLILADYSHGSKYVGHFDALVRDMVRCYERWSKVGPVPSNAR